MSCLTMNIVYLTIKSRYCNLVQYEKLNSNLDHYYWSYYETCMYQNANIKS